MTNSMYADELRQVELKSDRVDLLADWDTVCGMICPHGDVWPSHHLKYFFMSSRWFFNFWWICCSQSKVTGLDRSWVSLGGTELEPVISEERAWLVEAFSALLYANFT